MYQWTCKIERTRQMKNYYATKLNWHPETFLFPKTFSVDVEVVSTPLPVIATYVTCWPKLIMWPHLHVYELHCFCTSVIVAVVLIELNLKYIGMLLFPKAVQQNTYHIYLHTYTHTYIWHLFYVFISTYIYTPEWEPGEVQ